MEYETYDKKYDWVLPCGITVRRDTIWAGNFTRYGKYHTLENLLRILGVVILLVMPLENTLIWFVKFAIAFALIGLKFAPAKPNGLEITSW